MGTVQTIELGDFNSANPFIPSHCVHWELKILSVWTICNLTANSEQKLPMNYVTACRKISRGSQPFLQAVFGKVQRAQAGFVPQTPG